MASLPAALMRPGFEGVARRKAQSIVVRAMRHAGAPRRASRGVRPAPGPAFRFGHCAQLGQRPIAPVQMSASSWQGLVVAPEGAPAPPECDPAKIARRRRTPSRFTTPHDRAPQRTRWMQDIGVGECGDKFQAASYWRKPVSSSCRRRERKRLDPGFRRGDASGIACAGMTPRGRNR
jgi:hypothetical protein